MRKVLYSMKGSVLPYSIVILLLSMFLRTGMAEAASSQSCGMWSVVSSPTPPGGGAHLQSVAGNAEKDVWAVGDYINSKNRNAPLIEHWHGKQWIIDKAPNPYPDFFNFLRGVAVLSRTDVWTVGYSGYDGYGTYPVAFTEHWNGSHWSVVPVPSIGQYYALEAVTAISTNDVWAVGYYNVSPMNDEPLIDHWDGTQWSIVQSPNLTGEYHLYAVAALSTNDIWAVGENVASGATDTLIEHWDGSQWSIVQSPIPHNPNTEANDLSGITIVSKNDIWAVGTSILINGFVAYTEHWDGKRWRIVNVPNPEQYNELGGVVALSANDIWAVGFSFNLGTSNQTLIEQWDGTQWNLVPSPSPGSSALFSVAVSSVKNDTIWAVGATDRNTLTEFYC